LEKLINLSLILHGRRTGYDWRQVICSRKRGHGGIVLRRGQILGGVTLEGSPPECIQFLSRLCKVVGSYTKFSTGKLRPIYRSISFGSNLSRTKYILEIQQKRYRKTYPLRCKDQLIDRLPDFIWDAKFSTTR
jgi:hypothetical protein